MQAHHSTEAIAHFKQPHIPEYQQIGYCCRHGGVCHTTTTPKTLHDHIDARTQYRAVIRCDIGQHGEIHALNGRCVPAVIAIPERAVITAPCCDRFRVTKFNKSHFAGCFFCHAIV
ncbi:hypothetical protein BvCmsNSNP023_00709 [Escherichia coli]|nr:hypothetical protein BvCmsNSNP023_00709 [Escherichia coli]